MTQETGKLADPAQVDRPGEDKATSRGVSVEKGWLENEWEGGRARLIRRHHLLSRGLLFGIGGTLLGLLVLLPRIWHRLSTTDFESSPLDTIVVFNLFIIGCTFGALPDSLRRTWTGVGAGFVVGAACSALCNFVLLPSIVISPGFSPIQIHSTPLTGVLSGLLMRSPGRRVPSTHALQ